MLMSEKLKKMRFAKLVHWIKLFSNSASVALFLSVIFFSFEMFGSMEESKEMTDNLLKIQNSLSTKYLGEFPSFLPDINRLYAEVSKDEEIVVLEDVLFYGLNSAPEDFYEASIKLLDLAANGTQVMISYYEPNSFAYNLTIQEWMLSQESYKHYRDTLTLFRERSVLYKKQYKAIQTSKASAEEKEQKCHALLSECFLDIVGPQAIEKQKAYLKSKSEESQDGTEGERKALIDEHMQIRNLLLERYFSATRAQNKGKFQQMVEGYRSPTLDKINMEASTRTQMEVRSMCQKMDSVRTYCLGEEDTSVDSITYANFVNMFTEMTRVMEQTYKNYPSITLVPIDDFLSIRGWLITRRKGESRAIMAFPSRYSSSEIGFYTTDESTTDYIKTMQQGILVNYADGL
jgi:hypothetical protein